MQPTRKRAYWRANLTIVGILLAIWFLTGFVGGIWLVEPLNRIRLGQVGLGFWMSQQGAIFVFVALVLVYAVSLDRLDRRYEEDR